MFDSLRVLDMKFCSLKYLPPEVPTLNNLKIIDFSYNKLSVFPSNMFNNFHHTIVILIQDNSIQKLEQYAFCGLKRIKD